MTLKVGDVRVDVEETDGSNRWRVVAHWTPDGLSPRQLILGTYAGIEAGYTQAAVCEMLRHAYQQGRVDAALGF